MPLPALVTFLLLGIGVLVYRMIAGLAAEHASGPHRLAGARSAAPVPIVQSPVHCPVPGAPEGATWRVIDDTAGATSRKEGKILRGGVELLVALPGGGVAIQVDGFERIMVLWTGQACHTIGSLRPAAAPLEPLERAGPG